MLDLSPVKLLVIFLVGAMLLGPEKVPELARQLSGWWKKLKGLQQRIDDEVRQNLPDLPSTKDIARYAKSPMTLINHLSGTKDSEEPLESNEEIATVQPVRKERPHSIAGSTWDVPGDPNLN